MHKHVKFQRSRPMRGGVIDDLANYSRSFFSRGGSLSTHPISDGRGSYCTCRSHRAIIDAYKILKDR